MGIDRMEADDEAVRDLRVGHTLCEEAQYFQLAARQVYGVIAACPRVL